MGAMEANCGKCLHQKVCALWWAHERQDASCFSLDGCDCFEAAITPPNEPLTLEQLRESPHGKIKDSTLESICNRANEIASRPPEGEEDT